MATRGTEIDFSGIIHDVFGADIGDIGADGIAISQAIDLFNYYQRLTAGPGADIIQYSYTEALHTGGPVPIDRPARITATSVPQTDFRPSELGTLSGKEFTVTGHSLGGHLALIMSRLDPEHVRSAYTYNAPGFDTGLVPLNNNTAWFFNNLAQSQTEQTGSSTIDTNGFDSTRLNNFVTPSDRISHIGTIPGRQELIFSEGSDVFAAHKIGKMVDSLALQQLLHELDPTLDSSQAASYLSAASAEADNSLETVTGSLAHLLGVALASADNERENLYQQLASLREASGFTGHVDQLKFVPTPSLAAQAGSDSIEGLAYRYALERLNPFAVVGAADLYPPHNADGALDADQFSEQYLADRGRFLQQLLRANRADTYLVSDSPYRNQAYADLASDLRLATADALADSHFTANSQWPAQADRLIFGSADADEIEGGRHDDHLYGQAGDDILDGGAGNDYLEGGSGNDLYRFESGNGQDRLFDSDGQGRIVIDGDLLSGGELLAEGLWQSADGRHRYVLDGDSEGDTSLYIDGQLRVGHFHNGDLGITLAEDAAQPADIPNTLNGTTLPDTLWAGRLPEVDVLQAFTDPIQAFAGPGNDLIALADGNDTASGGEGNDWIVTFAGDDQIAGEDGDDILYPGAGQDVVAGGNGNDLIVDAHHRLFNTTGNADWDARIWEDLNGNVSSQVAPYVGTGDTGEAEIYYTLMLPQQALSGTSGLLDATFEYTPTGPTEGSIVYTSYSGNQQIFSVSYDMAPDVDDQANQFSGGAGDDFIGGNAGNDMLRGGPGNDRITGGGGADTLLGGADDDLLVGGAGDDWLDAGPGRDSVYGGSGQDILHGGADSDTLYGDNGQTDLGEDDFLLGGEGADRLYGNGGDDRIDGGAGDDRLSGQFGQDTLLGGDGDDRLDGGWSADILFGGAGNDVLVGAQQDDWLFGGDGSDTLSGGEGADRLDGGADSASDTLSGGSGEDVFIYHPNGGIDLVEDAADNDRVLLQDILPRDLSVSALYDIDDGQDLLALQIDANDILLVADGITAGPGEYLFSDGSRLPHGELIGQLLHQPLTFHLDQAGTLNGGTASDTLVGSPEDDRLSGHAGDDILAGAAGNDWLDGGAGRDRYLIGPGTGLDIIEEGDSESSELALLPGVRLDQLRYRRSGDDLRVLLPGDADGATLRHFFTDHAAWTVLDSDGGQRLLTPATLSVELEPVTPDSPIVEWKSRFTQGIEQAFGNALHLNGYQLQDDGRWHGDTVSGNNRWRRSMGFQIHSETPAGTHYTSSLHNFSTLSSSSHSTWEPTEIIVRQRGVMFVPAGERDVQFISLDTLQEQGISAFELARDAMPVFGENAHYDPLTGRLDREIIGYRLAVDGGIPLSQPSLRQRTITDAEMQVNILDLTLGAGDDRFDIRLSNATGFNLVDGGAGDDELDASRGSFDWGRSPLSLGIPGGDFWPASQLPGSLLYGNEGNDRLIGGDGADELIGGAGDDYLQGGIGNDTYRILSSTGMDTLYEDAHLSSAQDRLILPAGVQPDDVEYRWGSGLYRNLDTAGAWVEPMTSLHNTFSLHWGTDAGVTLVLPHSDQQAGLGIETVVFGDGEEVRLETLLAGTGFPLGQDPQQADNVLHGSRFLHGYGGNDTLIADYADSPSSRYPWSTLIGGPGSDRLIGGAGHDKLFGNDIVADYSRDFLEDRGNLWDAGNEYDGGPGNDWIWATAGSDLIKFGTGDGWDGVTDLLHDNLYISRRDYRGYGLGDPRLNDHLSNFDDPAALVPGHREQLYNSVDTLRFKDGIAPTDVQVRPNSDQDLVFGLSNGADGIIFTHWFDADLNQLGRVEFSDGTVWDRGTIDALAQGLDPTLLADPSSAPVEPDPGSPEEPTTAEEPQTTPDPQPAGDPQPLSPQQEVSSPRPSRHPLRPDNTTPWLDTGLGVPRSHSAPSDTRQAPLIPAATPRPRTPSPRVASRSSPTVPPTRQADSGTEDIFDHDNPSPDTSIRQQWNDLQRALSRLDGESGARAGTARHRPSGLGADNLSGLFGWRPKRLPTGHDPVSLSVGNVQLHGLAGLSEGMRPLSW